MVVVASSGAGAGSGSCFVGQGSRFSNLIHSVYTIFLFEFACDLTLRLIVGGQN